MINQNSFFMKRMLFIAAMALGFAACSEKGVDTPNAQSGEIEKSYVAISLASYDPSTRAEDVVYEDGDAEERKVNSVFAFFFNNNAAFPVSVGGEDTPNERCNYHEIVLEDMPNDETAGSETPNVSDIKEKVLLLQNYKGQYPNQIVAVVNWTPTKTIYSLDELQDEISSLGDDTDGYVMSNSAYVGDKKAIRATAITMNNIRTSEEDAMANPVTIYIERVAARIDFDAANGGRFNLNTEVDGTPIYAKIKGFELYNDYQESYLIKKVDPSWTDTSLGFTAGPWNDYAWHRSYWATSMDTTFENNVFSWNENNNAIGNTIYCGENTRERTTAPDPLTKVIIKAELQKEDGSPAEIAIWHGNEYLTEDNLLDAISTTLAHTYYSSADGSTFTGILAEDLACKARESSEENAYEAYFQLSSPTGEGKTWYVKNQNGTYTKYDDAAAFNAVLKTIDAALVYKSGMTYYYTDIKHLGASGSRAEYGVVRNHIYKVNITGITGFGTPVYEGDQEFIKPEKPEGASSFVAAQIRVLSWRVVDSNDNIILQ